MWQVRKTGWTLKLSPNSADIGDKFDKNAKAYKPQSADGDEAETAAWKKRGSYVCDSDLGTLAATCPEVWRVVGVHRAQQLVARKEYGEWTAIRRHEFSDRLFWSDWQ